MPHEEALADKTEHMHCFIPERKELLKLKIIKFKTHSDLGMWKPLSSLTLLGNIQVWWKQRGIPIWTDLMCLIEAITL